VLVETRCDLVNTLDACAQEHMWPPVMRTASCLPVNNVGLPRRSRRLPLGGIHIRNQRLHEQQLSNFP